MSIKGWHQDQERAYVWTGILLSSFLGFIVALFVGLGSHDWWTSFFAWVGVTLVCLHLTFWRCNG